MGCTTSKAGADEALETQKAGHSGAQLEVQPQVQEQAKGPPRGPSQETDRGSLSGFTDASLGSDPTSSSLVAAPALVYAYRPDYASCSRGVSGELPESPGRTTPPSFEAARTLCSSFSNQFSASSAQTSLVTSLGIENPACHTANSTGSTADVPSSPNADRGIQTMTSSLKSYTSSISSGGPPACRTTNRSDSSVDSVMSAPLPANEKHRQAAVDKLSAALYSLQQDPQLEGITQLVSQIFQVAICFITVFDKDLAVVLSAYGMSGPRFFARHKTMGAWTIVPEAKQLLVVEDMLDDARFRHHRSARWKKPLRFVAGAPLVTSSGHKIGALCMMDFRPRQLQGGMYVLFANLAEIAQVELERENYLDSHDMLKTRFPADGPIPLSIPMRHLSHMSATTPPLSSHSSDVQLDAEEPATVNSSYSVGPGPCSPKASILQGAASWRKSSSEAMQAAVQDTADVDLSELAEAWWISAQNGWPPDPCPSLRDQLRERVKAYVNELPAACDPTQMLAAMQSSSAGSIVPQSSTDTAIDISTTGSMNGNCPPGSPRFNARMIPQTRTGRNHRNSMMLLGTSTFDVELPDLSEGVLLCDALQPDWRVLVASTRCLQLLGLTRSQGVGRKLWDMLEVPGEDAEASLVRMERMLNTEPFVARMNVCRRPSAAFAPHTFKVRVSSACVSHVDHKIAVAGIPAFAAQRPEPEPRYFFVFLSLEGSQELTPNRHTSTPRRGSLTGNLHGADDKVFQTIRLGALLGKGAYGKVYHGIWNDQDVAVKIMEAFHNTQEEAAAEVTEIKVAQALQHPHIVQMLHCATRTVRNVFEGDKAGAWEGALEPPASRMWMVETWIILELCSKGTLQDACERGWFRPPGCAHKFDLRMVLQTALEVADAMCYLHDGNVIHGDLTHGNILLAASTADARRFTAKVADFGLSRFMTSSAVDTATFGTVTHMPPELLMEGKLTKAADVFAFGVLLWSMFTGRLPWQGFQRTQIMFKVTIKREQLKLVEDIPDRCKDLVNSCLDRDRHLRPSFQDLRQQLQAYLLDAQTELELRPAAAAQAAARSSI